MIVMHKNPNSNYLHEKMNYKNIVEEVNSHLQMQVDNLVGKGINEKQIAIDPGFWFWKNNGRFCRIISRVGKSD